MHTLANLINGRHLPPTAGQFIDSTEPATGGVLSRVPDSNKADVDTAVAAAKAAFPGWSATSAHDRSRLLLKLADLIDTNLDRLAEAESRDTGKPITLARSIDIPRSASNLRFFATAALHTHTEAHDFDGSGSPAAQGGGHSLHYTLRSPRGVAGLISPWNLPLYLLTWKIAPALATGNTAVCKPSEVTPLTAHLLGELAVEAGLPPGVLNIVHGRGPSAGAALVTHPDVPTVSFTGSTAVGRWIGKECGDMLKRVSLELGGKNPFIIFGDADLAEAIPTAARAAFTNQGQICLCGSRLIVHESVATQVTDGIVAVANALKIGDPLDPQTQQGSLTSREHFAKVDSYVKLARELGGKVLCGGSAVAASSLPDRVKGGSFYHPTVIAGLDPMCRVEQEEIFGPVVTIQTFKTFEEAMALANGTPYGLAGVVFTRDVGQAHRAAAAIQAGMTWINCWLVRDLRTPFGGAKQSGVGREGGFDAIKFFTEAKSVCVRV